MKKSKTREKKANPRGITRREFVGTTALAAAGVMAGAPAILRGRDLNGKLDIAFIACGGRARASLSELTVVPGRATGRGRGGENSPARERTRPPMPSGVTVRPAMARSSASDRGPSSGGGSMRIRSTA